MIINKSTKAAAFIVSGMWLASHGLTVQGKSNEVPDATVDVYELLYDEQEKGTDIYTTRMLVSDRYLRIDDLEDDSGYIVYDNKIRTIYSVSHFDKAILVMGPYAYKKPDLSGQVKTSYKRLKNSPEIAGHKVHSHSVTTLVENNNETCTEIHLAENLLPEVTGIFRQYQRIVAGQQVMNLDSTPEEYRTACFLADQVYNDGAYYEKGLPIQELHSNGKKKLLKDYKKKKISTKMFDLPDNYREYSLQKRSAEGG